MKKVLLLILLTSINLMAAEYTLDELLKSAVVNSGFSKQSNNYSGISKKEISDLISNYYPQFNIEGQATYQSDMFRIPLNLPGMTIPDLRKDQYNVWLNFTQLIWDGGIISNKLDMSEISTLANIENANTKIRNVIENTSNLYFAGKKIESNIKSISSAINTLESNRKQISSLVTNGMLNQSNLDAVDIQINTKQQTLFSLKEDYQSIIKKIRIFTAITDIETLSNYEVQLDSQIEINRSELKAMEYSQRLNTLKSDVNYSMNKPKISAFARVGYSNPNQLNMFEQEWSDYYMLGIKFTWKPFSWFSEDKNSEIISLQNENIELEKKEFEKQVNMLLVQEHTEIEKAKSLIEQDLLILNLQNRIIKEKYSQLLNGSATISEYISELNSLEIYDNNLSIHKVILENAKINLLIKSGNYTGVE
ncbi:MAG: TolC family protein [Candidatus Kapabacteria bacterium]|nr:TolC family protein [Candidatus Kapabacteria bacterium]